MPLNSIPLTTSLDALHEKVKAMDGKLWVDVGLLGGIIPGNEADISPLIDAGVLGFKCFMCDSGIPEFPPVNEKQILTAMNEIAKKVGVSCFEQPLTTFRSTPSFICFMLSPPKCLTL